MRIRHVSLVMASAFLYCGALVAQDGLPTIAPHQRLSPLPSGILQAIEVHERFVFVGSGQDLFLPTRPGVVYVFRKSRSSDCGVQPCWRMTGQLSRPNGFGGDRFGEAIKYDGHSLLIGSPDEHGINSRVFVYRQENGRFVLRQTLRIAEVEPNFGLSFSLHSGRAAFTTAGFLRGVAVYVFSRQGDGRWVREARLTAVDQDPADQFGFAVDLRGKRLIVGANEGNYAVVFRRGRHTGWREEQRLNRPELDLGFFGSAVDVRGTVAVVGNAYFQGSVFERTGGVWSVVDRLLPPDTAGNPYFGSIVELRGPNHLFISGGEGIHVFRKTDGSWHPIAKLVDTGVLALAGEERMDSYGSWLGVIGFLAPGAIPSASIFDISGILRNEEANRD